MTIALLCVALIKRAGLLGPEEIRMSKSKLQNLLVVSMAVSAVLMSTACSRKSAGQKNPIQTTQGTQAPKPTNGELDKDSGNSSQEGPSLDDDRDLDNDDDGPVLDEPQAGGPSLNEAPQNSGALHEDSPVVVHYDPSGMTPSQVFEASERQGESAAGALSDVAGPREGLRYSGAGQDDLRETLMRHENAKEKTRRNRDAIVAHSINQATFDVDWSTREARITLLMNGRRTQLNMSARLTNDLIARSGSVKRGNRIAVEAACMDLNGGCETVYMKVQDGNHGHVRTAHVLVRTTTATLFTQGNGYHIAKNEEYNYFLNLLLNTVGHSGKLNTVSSLWLRTTEVIGGVSNFIVQMGLRTTRTGPGSINWTGALVKPTHSASLNAPAELLPSTSPIANTIRETRLVRNDGRGNIQLAVTIRKATVEAQEDTLLLTFGRIHKPTVSLRVK
jgi:hypothetical protein